jgi:hypothetical protein
MNKQVEYMIGDDIMKVIQNTIYNFYAGKVDFLGPDPKRDVDIYTGLGGMMQVNNSIKEMTINSGLVINAPEIGTVTNRNDNCDDIGYFSSYVIPFLANVKFRIDTSMDNVDNGGQATEDNPFINGFLKSSYNYRVVAGEETVDIIATGARPDFKHELTKLIIDSVLDTQYEMSANRLTKCIMNYLNTLKL